LKTKDYCADFAWQIFLLAQLWMPTKNGEPHGN